MWKDHNISYTFNISRLYVTLSLYYYGRLSVGMGIDMPDYSNTMWINLDILKVGLGIRLFIRDK